MASKRYIRAGLQKPKRLVKTTAYEHRRQLNNVKQQYLLNRNIGASQTFKAVLDALRSLIDIRLESEQTLANSVISQDYT